MVFDSVSELGRTVSELGQSSLSDDVTVSELGRTVSELGRAVRTWLSGQNTLKIPLQYRTFKKYRYRTLIKIKLDSSDSG